MELMGIAGEIGGIDARGVEAVDAHLARGMDDAAVAQIDADMDDAALGIGEETEVVGLGKGKGGNGLALGGLLRGIAQQTDPAGFEADLGEARTVDAIGCAASPQIGGAKVAVTRHGARTGGQGLDGRIEGAGQGLELTGIDIATVAVVLALDEHPIATALYETDDIVAEELVDHLGAMRGLGAHGYGNEGAMV